MLWPSKVRTDHPQSAKVNPMTFSHAPSGLARRSFLRLAGCGVGMAALAGCSPSPLVDLAPTPSSIPTLDANRRAIAQANADLAVLASTSSLLAGIDDPFKVWAESLADQHLAYQKLLCQADPLAGVKANPTPVETITGAAASVRSQSEAAQLIAAKESDLADLISSVASEPNTQSADSDQLASMSLVWISQWLSASVARDAMIHEDSSVLGPPPVAGSVVPALTTIGTTAEAQQVVLTHQRALIFGLQAIYSRIVHPDDTKNLIYQRIGQVMRERDAMSSEITASGQTPPAQPPEYDIPGDITDPSQAQQIWGSLELAAMNAFARLAAVDDADRITAAGQALDHAERAHTLTTALPYWPGWV